MQEASQPIRLGSCPVGSEDGVLRLAGGQTKETGMPSRTALADGGDLAHKLRDTADLITERGPAFDEAWKPEPGRDQPAPATDQLLAAGAGATHAVAQGARPRILLTGEKGFTSLLKYIMESNGFDCILTDNWTDAIAAAAAEQPSLIALDDTSCGDRVILALKRLHEDPRTRHIPTLIMASVSPHLEQICVPADRVSYILKPFLPDVFIDRLHGLLRESAAVNNRVLRFADIVMESDAHRVSRGGRCIRLCPVEYRILQHLLECPRRVFSREQILARIRAHSEDGAVRSIDVHISRIRKALCAHGEPNYIRTVRGMGYSLDVAPDGPAAYVPRPNLARDTRKPSRSEAPVADHR
jgi:two-component system phosphate regulon response regulator PhoB